MDKKKKKEKTSLHETHFRSNDTQTEIKRTGGKRYFMKIENKGFKKR